MLLDIALPALLFHVYTCSCCSWMLTWPDDSLVAGRVGYMERGSVVWRACACRAFLDLVPEWLWDKPVAMCVALAVPCVRIYDVNISDWPRCRELTRALLVLAYWRFDVRGGGGLIFHTCLFIFSFPLYSGRRHQLVDSVHVSLLSSFLT